MDRSLATAELPLLNRDEEYVSDANRTFEDDNPISIPISERLYKRVHLTDSRFKMIYRDTIRFFTKMEKHSYIQYLTGEKDKNEFKRDLENYLRRNFPDICKYDKEEEIEDANGQKRTIIVNPDLEEIMKRIRQSLFGYDVLQPLIDNEETTDIKICSPYDIRVRIKGKAYQSDAHFIDDMDELYKNTDLIICRAGALTVAETSCAGIPAIFVPLPGAVDDHQTKNAGFVQKNGGAIILPQAKLTSDSLYEVVKSLVDDKEKLKNMAKAASACAVTDSTRRVLELIDSVVKE